MRNAVCLLLLLCGFLCSQAQTKTITGKVIDQNGQPVDGASITIKGTTNGTAAAADGSFTLSAAKGRTLVISAVNFATAEVQVTDASDYPVTLKPQTNEVKEVVVTALGIKREKRSLSYATQAVSSDQLNKSGTNNPLSELNGKAAGLTVINSSGEPGGGTYIRLRGVTSITGNNQPLMIIDGVPIDNSINNFDPTNAGAGAAGANGNLTGGAQPTNRGVDINPNDIESINVLKGPAATALYGIQAASGAIVITTKKGNAGRKGTSIVFNSSVTFDKVSKLPGLQDKYAQGSDGQYSPPEDGGSISWGAAIDTLSWDGANDYPFDKHGHIVGRSDPSAKTPVTPYDRYTFFRTGTSFNNNIALSGGNDKTSYRFSLGNLYQQGIIPKSKYVKTTVSLNGQSKITEKLTASGGITYTNSTNNKVQQGSNLSGVMLGLVRTPATFDNSNGYSDAENHPDAYMLPDGTQRNYRGGGGYDNPYWTVNKSPFTSDLDRVFGYGQASYQVLDWLSLTYRLGGDIYGQNDKNSYDINTSQFAQGAVFLNNYTNKQFNSDFIINMHKTWGNDWDAALTLGHNYFTLNQSNRLAQGTTLLQPGFFDISNASSYLSTETLLRKRTMAFYGQFDLNYKRELYLTLTARRETSSTLPANNNTFFYPSVSAGWIFTELNTFKSSKILSFGKLRASFAQVGKDAPIYALNTPFTIGAFKDGFTTGINFPVNGVGGYQISSGIATIGNPDLKPENTYSYELGADLSFLKNRINLNGTAYYSESRDVIFPTSIPYSTGYAAKLLNAATISNKGLELTLNVVPLVLQNGLKWDVTINWSRNLNKVKSLTPGVDRFFVAGFGGGEAEIDAVVGQPFGMIYGNTFVRSDPNNMNSQLLINDIAGDGYAQPLAGGPNAVIGNTNPDWIGSAISNLTFKGFTFGFQFDIRHGGQMWNGTRGALANKGTSYETANRGTSTVFKGLLGHLDANGNVVHLDKDGVTELPGPGVANTIQSKYDQYYWQNIGSSFGSGPQEVDILGSGFSRLRQISLSYELPQSIYGPNAKFTSISVTIFANNLWLMTKYDGVDPETSLAGPANAQGLDYFNNPGTKSYGIRLNIGL